MKPGFFYFYGMEILNEQTVTVIITTLVGIVIRAIEKRQMKKKDREKWN